MKIVQICTNVMSGSVGSIVRNLYEGIVGRGDECLICYGRGKIPEGYKYYKFNTSLDIYYHVIMARLFDSDGLHSKMATKRLIKRLKDYAPDIVHIHCLHGYYINYPLLFKYFKESNVKVVWTMHDCWAFTGHCCNFEYVECMKWLYNCEKCIQKKRYPKSILCDKSARNYSMKKDQFNQLENFLMVTPSKWLCDIINNSFLNGKKIKVIQNGVDTNIFRFQKSKLDKLFPTILSVASIWENSKGFNDLIELSNILPKDIKLVVVGVTEKQRNKFGKNVICINRTNSVQELVDLYNNATIFFNPTYEDNYPTVNIEAACCNLPIVTYGAGGSAECINNLKYGWIIKNKDYQTLLEITRDISKLQYEDILIDKSLFSKKNMVKKYLDIYKE